MEDKMTVLSSLIKDVEDLTSENESLKAALREAAPLLFVEGNRGLLRCVFCGNDMDSVRDSGHFTSCIMRKVGKNG